jgi:hypothetical protein
VYDPGRSQITSIREGSEALKQSPDLVRTETGDNLDEEGKANAPDATKALAGGVGHRWTAGAEDITEGGLARPRQERFL